MPSLQCAAPPPSARQSGNWRRTRDGASFGHGKLVRFTARLQPVATGSPQPASLCFTGLPPKFCRRSTGNGRLGQRTGGAAAYGHPGRRSGRLQPADGSRRGGHARPVEGTSPRTRRSQVAEHRGHIVKTTGDGLLAEFASVVDAVGCAVEFQREMAVRNAGVPPDRRIEFRVGINLGDIISEEGDISQAPPRWSMPSPRATVPGRYRGI